MVVGIISRYPASVDVASQMPCHLVRRTIWQATFGWTIVTPHLAPVRLWAHEGWSRLPLDAANLGSGPRNTASVSHWWCQNTHCRERPVRCRHPHPHPFFCCSRVCHLSLDPGSNCHSLPVPATVCSASQWIRGTSSCALCVDFRECDRRFTCIVESLVRSAKKM